MTAFDGMIRELFGLADEAAGVTFTNAALREYLRTAWNTRGDVDALTAFAQLDWALRDRVVEAIKALNA